MFGMLRRWFGKRSAARDDARPAPAVRPRLEELEGRLVPAVSIGNGVIIPHVQVSNVFYGQDWSQPANQADIQGLNQFMNTITHSSYLSMLGEYGVGQGSFRGSDVTNSGPAANATVTEDQIQAMLKAEITSGRASPGAPSSSFYVVFLPPNVHSQNDPNDLAHGDLAHHGSFTMPVLRYVGVPGSLQGRWITVYQQVFYAVIPHPQGNLADNDPYIPAVLATDFQKQTEIVSHELAEGVTDPNGNGWRDYTHNSADGWWEIGDITNLQVASLDGYFVQREWSNYWQRGITPLFDTGGALLSFPGQYVYGARTAEGRTGSLVPFPYLQMSWQLDDGSSSGWYIVG